MATKGPSNRYGNSRGGRQDHKTVQTGFAWAKDFNKKTLLDHFERHGAQMSSDTTSSYAAHAIKLRILLIGNTVSVLLIKKALHINTIKRQMNMQ